MKHAEMNGKNSRWKQTEAEKNRNSAKTALKRSSLGHHQAATTTAAIISEDASACYDRDEP
jgi:hypothetical protein